MLQTIRDKTQGWIAGVIISLLILSFALWGIHSYLVGGSASNIVAKVDGFEITKSQLAVAYERLRRQLQIQYQSNYALPQAEESALKGKALQTLINIQVLRQSSIQQGYRVSDNQVDSLLESMPDFKVNGRFSLTRFQEVLSTTLFNPEDFLNLLKTSLLIDQPRLGLLLTSYALPTEVNDAIALVKQERDINYAIAPVHTLITQPIVITHEQVESYYKTHQDDFKTPEQVSIEYIELSVNDLMAAMHPADSELKAYYNENSSAFAEPMQWKLSFLLVPVTSDAVDKDVKAAQDKVNAVHKKVQGGESFAAETKQYPVGKEFEKLTGWVTLNQVPQSLQKTVMGLTKANQLSAPIRTMDGFLLVQATEVKEPKIEPYEAVQAKVKESYIHQQAEEKFGVLKDKLASSTYEHPDSLAGAAQLLNLPVKSTELFTKDKGGKDISSRTQIREAAFSNDVLNLHNNSDVIQVGADTALVLRVKTHTPATLLALNVVEQQISDKLKLQQENIQAAKVVDEIVRKLNTDNNSQAITQQYNLSWTNAGYIGRHAKKVDSAILDEAFAMPKPQANKVIYSSIKLSTGYAIIALNSVKPGAFDKNDEYDVFGEQLQSAQGLLEYELYKNSLIEQSKITIENSQNTAILDG